MKENLCSCCQSISSAISNFEVQLALSDTPACVYSSACTVYLSAFLSKIYVYVFATERFVLIVCDYINIYAWSYVYI